ncbi:AbrB/MazE/SpoVT family DNA-binding domain-containing protein [Candidatus Micrarchaeota archaeon]|nr:AbrB/MazE/SpoVT family DNA-binding domain-containing protein [Candidatus Micrarchaeota archaeon]MBU2476544.1 AbrB/MazE/SpoVT family DNA-binding domain-containing protein [Candidatus Micrarchaeota archaeon]
MYVGTSTVTSKGQLTIPLEIRKKEKLKTGSDVLIIDTEFGVLIKKSEDIKALFSPFERIAKKEKLSRKKLIQEVEKEKLKTLALFK